MNSLGYVAFQKLPLLDLMSFKKAVLAGIGTLAPVQLIVIVQLATPVKLIGLASAIDFSVRGIGTRSSDYSTDSFTDIFHS